MDHLDAMSPSVKILSIILLSFIGCCMVLCCIGYFIHRKQMRQRKRSQISPELRVPESIFAIQISDGPIMEVDHIPTYDNYSFEKPPPSYESVSRSASGLSRCSSMNQK